MKKEVTVHKTNDGNIMVSCDKNACEGCKSSLFCRGKNYEFIVENPDNIKLKDGDKALIDMPTGRTILSSFMSLFFPLICFFIPLFVSAAFFTSNEVYQFVSALVGLAIGFLISCVYFKLRKKEFLPTIIEKKEDKWGTASFSLPY